MTGDALDPETLAAFLEGRLSKEERDQVLRALDESPGDVAWLADASAALSALEPAGGAHSHASSGTGQPVDQVAQARGRRLRLSLGVGGLAAAAALAMLLLLRPGSRPGAPADVSVLLVGRSLAPARGDGALARALGEGWSSPGWTVWRGSEAGTLTPRQRSTRIGARLADVGVALDAQDRTAAVGALDEVIALLADVDAAGPVAAEHARLRTALRSGGVDDSVLRAASAAREHLRSVLASPWVDLGSWEELARLAAATEQWSFFSADRGGSALDQVVRRLEEGSRGDAVPPAVLRLRARMRAGVRVADSAALRVEVAQAIRESAG